MIWRLSDLPELQHLSTTQRQQLLRLVVRPGFYLKLVVASVALGLGLLMMACALILIVRIIINEMMNLNVFPQQFAAQPAALAAGVFWVFASILAYQLFIKQLRR